MTAMDLPAADTLSRAADLIEGKTPDRSEWIGSSADPHTAAALASLLRKAAKHCGTARGPVPLSLLWWGDLVTFARRLLREEDGEPNTVTVEAGGRLVDVPRLPLADGRREETP